eukprot:COSAG06_NODE_63202_length_263_cov_0.554878_1_plen_66_part_01
MINRSCSRALWIYGSILILHIYLHTIYLLTSCAVTQARSPSRRAGRPQHLLLGRFNPERQHAAEKF